jgi:hypothetical protein
MSRFTISKVPAALRHHHYGGLNTAAACRKANFITAGPRFLIGLGSQIGITGQIETIQGRKTESGTARLVADRLVLEISEPAERDGLQLRYFACDSEFHNPIGSIASESVESLAPDGALEDFVWRVKRMLSSNAEGRAPMSLSQNDLFC